MNYFEFYPGDYLRDTTRLTLSEHGAYVRMLMAYYSDEKPLPAEESDLFRVVSALKKDEKSAVISVANRFFPVGYDGLRHNDRADAEIAKAGTRMGAKGERKTNEAQRQQRYRDRRRDMFEALHRVGVHPDFNIPMDELTDIVTKNVTLQGVTNVTESQRYSTATRPQTPDPNKQQEQKKEREKTTAVEIDTWIASLDGADAIPEEDSIFKWADDAGIPMDYLHLAWVTFRDDMRERHKRQKDWRAHFRNAAKRNWYKLWWVASDGECKLTTAGEIARRVAT